MTRYVAIGRDGDYPIIATYDEHDEPTDVLSEVDNVDLIRPDGVLVLHATLNPNALIVRVN